MQIGQLHDGNSLAGLAPLFCSEGIAMYLESVWLDEPGIENNSQYEGSA